MGNIKYVLLGLSFLCIFIILILSVKTKKAFRFMFLNSFLGVFVFLSIYFTKKFTGIEISLNYYTLFGSAIYGIPGVVGLLILNLIF